jgi:hypothetical protein
VYVSFEMGKIQILLVKRNLQSVHYYPEGANPLCAGVIPRLGTSCLEALASGKLVYREVCSEGSQPAKVCTDEKVLQD